MNISMVMHLELKHFGHHTTIILHFIAPVIDLNAMIITMVIAMTPGI
jgi:hypothetical protein